MELNKEYSCKKINEGMYGNIYSLDDYNLIVKAIDQNNMSLIELDIMSRLRHQNLIQALDFGIFNIKNDNIIMKVKPIYKNGYGEKFCLIMEKGFRDLEDYKPKSKEELLDIIEQIKNGLAYLHKNNIIHGDIKPSNIILFDNFDKINAKIIDFGQSSYSGKLTTKNKLIGTPGFRAPELYDDTIEVDKSIDYWALGNLIFTLVTGIDTIIVYGEKYEDYYEYFGNKSQVQIDDIIYNNFMRLGYPELIDFTQKCLTIDYKKRVIDIDNIDISYNLSIYKDVNINNEDMKFIISYINHLDKNLGYDVILKILQFHISNYNLYGKYIKLSCDIFSFYLNKININSYGINQYYFMFLEILDYCSGIINNYSLFDTPFRNIDKIESLEDYNFIFKYYIKDGVK